MNHLGVSWLEHSRSLFKKNRELGWTFGFQNGGWLLKWATPFNCNVEGNCDKPFIDLSFSPQKKSDLNPSFEYV
jgi:hypothetical protein